MNILLLESGYNRNYRVNLALSKISASLKGKGHNTHHAVLSSRYKYPKSFSPDRVYISATFSYDLPYLKKFMDQLTSTYPHLKEEGKVIFGGVCTYHMKEYIKENFGVVPFTGCSYELDHSIPDFEFGREHVKGKIEKDSSYVFTQRSCPRGCSYCVVPKIEPESYTIDNWKDQIDMTKKYVFFMDNNIFSTSLKHRKDVFSWCEEYAHKDGVKVEKGKKNREIVFDSGLDFRGITEENMELIKNINFHKIKIAWDDIRYEKVFDEKIRMLLSYFPKTDSRGLHRTSSSNIEAYVLYNCPYTKDTLEDTLYRVYKLRYEYGILAYLMRYQPLDTLYPKTYLSPYWTEEDAKDIARWTNNRYVFLSCGSYKFYKGRNSEGKCLSVSDKQYLNYISQFSNKLAIDFKKTFKENLAFIKKEIKEREELLKRFEEKQLSFAI